MHSLNRMALSLVAVLLATLPSLRGQAPQRATFDGHIRNNALALSPDEKTAVVSYSERSEVIVYDLAAGKVRGQLKEFVTPRNILFAPDGQVFYVSDSSRGLVVKVDARTLKPVAQIAAGPGAFGTALSRDGKAFFVNNRPQAR